MGIFNWLLHRDRAVSEPAGFDNQQTREAVERIAAMSPRLRFANRYQEHLGAAVRLSLEYVGKLAETLPAPLEASASAWSSDPHVHAFFATAADVTEAISRSADVQAYFDQHPSADEVIGVLSMAMTERNGMGVKQEGGITRTDVAWTTVSFGDHVVRLCGGTVEAVRQEVIRLAIDQLAVEGLARIEADASRRAELEEEHALLKARLQLLERRSVGMSSLANGGALAKLTEAKQVQEKIDENEENLANLGQRTDALERQLALVCEVLSDPAAHVDVSKKLVRLNRMNVIVESGGSEAGTEIEFRVAHIPGNPPRTRALALVRIARADLMPATSLTREGKHFVI
ncbi:hypothetical protein FAZ95_31220 [Trinickia violacea]|uniref:Uncharacterized protein n=1 Tax=Trinickia violacea TaxID=2571746 RepID=A0A4P8J0S8_9BURK|nr:hypothetical protein [Trinickia violacea]QCP53513.1 hypothetical protein FAZ95_31220 [Trinickia violacea]